MPTPSSIRSVRQRGGRCNVVSLWWLVPGALSPLSKTLEDARRSVFDALSNSLAPVSFSELCVYRTAGRSSVDRAPPRLKRHTSGVSRSMSGDEYFGGP